MNYQLCDKIINLHQEMQDLTLQAGGPPEHFHEVIDLDERDPEVDHLEKLDFLTGIRQNEFERVREIWILLKPEHWAGYELHDIKGLREQRLLEEARKNLRKAWKNRYGPKIATEQNRYSESLEAECI
jgi:hypothetical protein